MHTLHQDPTDETELSTSAAGDITMPLKKNKGRGQHQILNFKEKMALNSGDTMMSSIPGHTAHAIQTSEMKENNAGHQSSMQNIISASPK